MIEYVTGNALILSVFSEQPQFKRHRAVGRKRKREGGKKSSNKIVCLYLSESQQKRHWRGQCCDWKVLCKLADKGRLFKFLIQTQFPFYPTTYTSLSRFKHDFINDTCAFANKNWFVKPVNGSLGKNIRTAKYLDEIVNFVADVKSTKDEDCVIQRRSPTFIV